MKLIYRGLSYTHITIPDKLVRQSRAINWRYRLLGAVQIEILPVEFSRASRSAQPCVINWRYQIPAEG